VLAPTAPTAKHAHYGSMSAASTKNCPNMGGGGSSSTGAGQATASAFALDASGRLWVATSGATSHGRDAVYLIPRAGARPRRVVSRANGPLGLLWDGGRLYVASLGRVDAYGGLRGARFATHRTIVRERPGTAGPTPSCGRPGAGS
jgi:hypothetical protein